MFLLSAGIQGKDQSYSDDTFGLFHLRGNRLVDIPWFFRGCVLEASVKRKRSTAEGVKRAISTWSKAK